MRVQLGKLPLQRVPMSAERVIDNLVRRAYSRSVFTCVPSHMVANPFEIAQGIFLYKACAE